MMIHPDLTLQTFAMSYLYIALKGLVVKVPRLRDSQDLYQQSQGEMR